MDIDDIFNSLAAKVMRMLVSKSLADPPKLSWKWRTNVAPQIHNRCDPFCPILMQLSGVPETG